MLVVVVYLTGGLSSPNYFFMPLAQHPGFSINSELYLGYFRLLTFNRFFCCQFVSFYRKRYGFEKTFFTPRCFLLCTPSPHLDEVLTQVKVE